MAEQSKKITLYIFLFALFIMLAFFIAVNIYNIYITNKTDSLKTTKGTLECSFSFSIDSIRYSVPELSFNLHSSDINSLKKLIIDVDGIKTEVVLGEFFDYAQKVVVKDIIIQDSFRVYPDGCEDYNIKECSIIGKNCITIK
ncbi:MAG: hypothetical protein NT001_05915 [Candidatus Woesearchaeota archaeon]|nr:hypothetical protein [Candidatus Woesearchaeota archaeon]